MKKITSHINDTIMGGLFFMVPMFVIIFLVRRMWVKTIGTSKSLAGLFGIQKAMEGGAGAIITICIILLICFISGLLLRVALVSKLRNRLDAFLDEKIPGYGFYKLTMEQRISKENAPSRPVVLLNVNGVGQPGVVIEEMADGRKVVFVSSQPGSINGSVYVVDPGKVTELATTELAINAILKLQGEGLAKVVVQKDLV